MSYNLTKFLSHVMALEMLNIEYVILHFICEYMLHTCSFKGMRGVRS